MFEWVFNFVFDVDGGIRIGEVFVVFFFVLCYVGFVCGVVVIVLFDGLECGVLDIMVNVVR